MTIEKATQYFMTALEAEQLSSHTLKAHSQDLNQFKKDISKPDLDALIFEDFQCLLQLLQQLIIHGVC